MTTLSHMTTILRFVRDEQVAFSLKNYSCAAAQQRQLIRFMLATCKLSHGCKKQSFHLFGLNFRCHLTPTKDKHKTNSKVTKMQ